MPTASVGLTVTDLGAFFGVLESLKSATDFTVSAAGAQFTSNGTTYTLTGLATDPITLTDPGVTPVGLKTGTITGISVGGTNSFTITLLNLKVANVNAALAAELGEGDLTALDELLVGGNWTINGNDVANTAAFAAEKLGNYVWNLAGGEDTLLAGFGNDVLNGGDANDSLNGNAGNDTLNGDAGQDRLFGEAGNDTLNGGADVDRLDGGDDNDTLDGGAGDIVDTLIGGFGDDTFRVSDATGVDVIQGGEGYDRVNVTASSFKWSTLGAFESIEELKANGGATLNLTGLSDVINVNGSTTPALLKIVGFDKFNGGIGDDRITGGTIAETLNGEAGLDTLAGGGGADRLFGGDGDDSLAGDAGIDSINGGLGVDRIDGGSENDVISGGDDTENDSLFGGTGNDTFFVSVDDGVDAIDGGENVGDKDVVIVAGIDVDLSDLNIVGGVEEVQGNGVNAVLTLTGDPDSINVVGDTVRPYAITGFVRINAGGGNDTVTGSAGAETLNGGDGLDQLNGAGGIDRLNGDGGNDTLNGGAGNDSLVGGLGLDTLNGDEGNDSLFGGDGGDADVLNGGLGDDIFRVSDATGADRIYGGGGNDVVQASGQIFSFANVFATGTTPAYDFDELKTIASAAVLKLTDGNDTVNVLNTSGVLGAFKVTGFATFNAGKGNDTVTGGNSNETLNGNEGVDRLIGGKGNDWLSGGANTEGTAEVDTLDGGDGNDTFSISTGTGADSIIGGLGNDVVIVGGKTFSLDDLNASSVEELRAGTFGSTLNLTDEDDTVAVPVVTGAFNVTGFTTFNAGTGNDKVTGGVAGEVMNGEAGRDTLDGGAGNDRLDGGSQTDVVDDLSGGLGNDTFIVTNTSGVDKINGGLGKDVVLVKGGVFSSANLAATSGVEDVRSETTRATLNLTSDDDTINLTGPDEAPRFINFATISAGTGDDRVIGTTNGETLNGGAGADSLNGNDGADILIGGTENDILLGGAGADNLNGADGNDVLTGGAGADTMRGGDGQDDFIFASGQLGIGPTADTITDFRSGTDDIDLSAFNLTFQFTSATTFAASGANQVRYTNGSLFIDIDSDSGAEFQIKLLLGGSAAAFNFGTDVIA